MVSSEVNLKPLALHLTASCSDVLNVYDVTITVGQNEYFSMTPNGYFNHRNKLLDDITAQGLNFEFITTAYNMGEIIRFETKNDLVAFKLEFM